MTKKRGYSNWIKPVLYIVDLLLIFVFLNFFLTKNTIDLTFFAAFWIALSISFSFYNVYRFTKIIEIVSLLFKQISIFVLFIFTYLYIKDLKIPFENVLRFFVFTLVLFNLWRIILHIIFRKYRIITGSNYKQVVIVGWNHSAKKLEEFFYNNPGYGYKFIGYFTNEEEKEKKGSIAESFDFILKNRIDEVYCSVKELTNSQIKEFIDFCDINLKTLKFIPDSKELFSKNLYLNYYDITPILSLRDIPLNDPIKTLSKRIFDILFSSVIIIFVLSWAIPVLGLIIVLESRGPIFFKQNRPGIKEKGFGCYKFRSMTLNGRAEDSATRNDIRVTRVGKFIRRTSIDELPQFFNVLFGSMSVVGPRPHLWRQNQIYGPNIPKYMVRHFVKPGITGLAQVRGYRGEIQTRDDIMNRTKYDIFYIENWSLLMDFNIIAQTVMNIFKGEEKAY
jgi:putative colanic acid biosynthesis UDP-glucose lipid carrier transferase